MIVSVLMNGFCGEEEIAAARKRFEASHDISWVLRRLVGIAADAEPFEAAAEGVGMEVENAGRAVFAFDDPIGLLDRKSVV